MFEEFQLETEKVLFDKTRKDRSKTHVEGQWEWSEN